MAGEELDSIPPPETSGFVAEFYLSCIYDISYFKEVEKQPYGIPLVFFPTERNDQKVYK